MLDKNQELVNYLDIFSFNCLNYYSKLICQISVWIIKLN